MPANFCLKHHWVGLEDEKCPTCRDIELKQWYEKPDFVIIELRIKDNINTHREFVHTIALPKSTFLEQPDHKNLLFKALEQMANRCVPGFLNFFHTDSKDIQKKMKKLIGG